MYSSPGTPPSACVWPGSCTVRAGGPSQNCSVCCQDTRWQRHSMYRDTGVSDVVRCLIPHHPHHPSPQKHYSTPSLTTPHHKNTTLHHPSPPLTTPHYPSLPHTTPHHLPTPLTTLHHPSLPLTTTHHSSPRRHGQ